MAEDNLGKIFQFSYRLLALIGAIAVGTFGLAMLLVLGFI